jgi:hypothetical protein
MNDQPFRTTTPTTRPQMPQEPRNRSPWPWVALSCIILAAVYLLRDTDAPMATAQPILAPVAAQTMVVEVVLLLPTPTVTPIPTLYPTAASKRVTINDCGTATPGAICSKPQPPAPTTTPYPNCERLADLRPGDFCQW